jgi:hypothetical protein
MPSLMANRPRSALTSLAKILVWLMEEWYANLFWDKKGTLLICDRYYHDLLVDPRRYRYGGPAWAAKLVGKTDAAARTLDFVGCSSRSFAGPQAGSHYSMRLRGNVRHTRILFASNRSM